MDRAANRIMQRCSRLSKGRRLPIPRLEGFFSSHTDTDGDVSRTAIRESRAPFCCNLFAFAATFRQEPRNTHLPFTFSSNARSRFRTYENQNAYD